MRGREWLGNRWGSLRHRVTIMRPPGEDDVDPGTGQPLDQWQPVITLWAEVRDLLGNRLLAAQQVHQHARTEVRLRWTDKIEPDHQIWHGDRRMVIVGAPMDPDGRRRELICHTREVT